MPDSTGFTTPGKVRAMNSLISPSSVGLKNPSANKPAGNIAISVMVITTDTTTDVAESKVLGSP